MSHKRTVTSSARTPRAAGEYDRPVSDVSRSLEQATRGAALSSESATAFVPTVTEEFEIAQTPS